MMISKQRLMDCSGYGNQSALRQTKGETYNSSPAAPVSTLSQDRLKELADRFDRVKDEASTQALLLRAMAQRSATPAVSESLLQQALDSAQEVSLDLVPLAKLAVSASEIGWDPDEVQKLRAAAHDKLQADGALDGNPLASAVKRHGTRDEQVTFLLQVANEDASISEKALAVARGSRRKLDYVKPVYDVHPLHYGLAKGVVQADPAYKAEAELLKATDNPWYAPWRSRALYPLALIRTPPAASIGELAEKAANLCKNQRSFRNALDFLGSQDLNPTDRKIVELLEQTPKSNEDCGYAPHVAGLRHIGEHEEFTDRTVLSVLSSIQNHQNGHFRSHKISGFAAKNVESPQLKAALEAFPMMTNYPSRMWESNAWQSLIESPSDQDPVLSLAKAASPGAVAAVESAMNGESPEAPGEYIDYMAFRLLANDAADPSIRAAAMKFAKEENF